MRSLVAVSSLALVALGCGGAYDATPYRAGAPSVTLALASAGPMVSAGETRAVTAVLRDAGGAVVPSPELSWSSSAPGVATVSGDGASATITAVDDGVATITAASGALRGEVAVAVHRTVASVLVSAPAPVLVFGSSMQLTATARDALDNPIAGVTGFTFSSGNPASVVVSEAGLATALFDLHRPPTTVTASVTRDGATVSGEVVIIPRPPDVFDHAALLLTEYERPAPVPTLGQGAVFFTAVDGTRVDYLAVWSALSGPATAVHLHGPATGVEIAEVLVDLPPGPQTESYGSVTGSFTAADILPQGGQPPISLDALIALMDGNDAYVEVRTAAFPAGEIRGQILPTP